MPEEEVAPALGIRGLEMVEREDGKPVVIVATHRIKDEPVSGRHCAGSLGRMPAIGRYCG
jgi:hypothetical protein